MSAGNENGGTKGQRRPPLSRNTNWTRERIALLPTAEVRQLHSNAERLQEPEIAALCTQVLSEQRRSKSAAARSAAPKRHKTERRLVSRANAFGLRGVGLANRFWSRSGLTSGGEVVFAMWADDVLHAHFGGSCLLWAPNVEGRRSWSDSPGGRERLEHCRRALAHGTATGMLVYGTRLPGVLPEEKAARVDGVDPSEALALRVEKRGQEYWAIWGEAAPPRA